jgi:nitric oxide reductase NorD protein
MDIFEKLFQTALRQVKGRKKISSDLQLLCSNSKAIESICSSILSPAFKPQIVPSIEFLGFQGHFLFLPPEISVIPDASLNRKIFLNLALQSVAAYNLRLFQNQNRSSSMELRVDFLKNIPACNRYLDNMFEGYKFLQDQVFSSFQTKNLNTYKHGNLFSFWQSAYMCLETTLLTFNHQFKKNEQIPSYLFLTVPCLANEKISSLTRGTSNQTQKESKKQDKEKTEIVKPHEQFVESVVLKNEKINPVTHSFEKMETADEYQGGRRIDSGNDELQDHSEALKDLSLHKVTRDGEAAQSIYRSESSSFDFVTSSEAMVQKSDSYSYPEWNSKSSSYLQDYCRVFENPIGVPLQPSNFKFSLEKTYRVQLQERRREIQNLVNTPLWVNRLREGEELDYDSVVRDFAALRCKKEVEGKWYSRKLRRIQDFSVLILFDQSLSSDSWVKNQRVLDVILHSIGIAGILFEDVIKTVQVAGAWSSTRSKCSYQIYKNFDEPWTSYFDCAKGIEPQGYTRLGPAIRHATELLSSATTRHKLLLILTDGKPTDLDGYEGRYGIEDVKRACHEAENRGILPFALAIDGQAKHYFPKMFAYYRLLSRPESFSGEIYKVLLQVIGKGG